jgi:diguanylate cyclase (GGDEF)-like protein
MSKLMKLVKKHFLGILAFLIGLALICVCMVITQSQMSKNLVDQWRKSLVERTNSVDEMEPGDEQLKGLLENTFSNVKVGGQQVEAVAFLRRKGTGETGLVFYSTVQWCKEGSSIQDFFRSNDVYNCYNTILGNTSGSYKCITVEGVSYYVVFSYLQNCQMSVVQFVPASAAENVFSPFKVGCAIILALVVLFLIISLLASTREKRKLLVQLDEAHQTMKDKDARMDMLSYLMNEFTFEYDVEKDVLSFSEKYHTIFQRGRNFIRFRETIQSHYTVYHMDISKLQEVYEDVKAGKEEGSVLFRLQMTGGNYEWFRAVYKVMYSVDRKPKYVVGKMLNVHQSQTEKEMLLTKSTRDPLTNLLNRSEMEKRTTAYIEGMDSEDLAALLIMDLDHFKQVNDTFGHSKGDDLLRDVAAVIRDNFRTNDIVARLGGDEFFVFMKDIASDKDAVNKCEKLRLALYRDVTYGEQTVKISASMGIIFVKQGAQFLDIYMKADSALYRAKENGRNQICTYSEENVEAKEEGTTDDVTG